MTAAEARKALSAAKAKAFVNSLVLKYGAHGESKKEYCIMEAVAFVAGEPHTDSPKCASRVVAAFCRNLNDRWDDERRQKLKPYVLRIAGTAADDKTERKRAYMCADWAVRKLTPIWLEAAKLNDWAEKLRALPELVDEATANAGRDLARKAREAGWAAWKEKKAAYAACAAAAAYADADAAACAAAAYAACAAAAAYADAAAAACAAAAYAACAAAADAADAAAAARAKADASALALLDRLISLTEKPKKRRA